ncbi:MAG: hypothetical protein IJ802_03935 [Kiritimatiellae bacterium]|nr:hypothetical protein [Kiritimatiellia bacterium]
MHTYIIALAAVMAATGIFAQSASDTDYTTYQEAVIHIAPPYQANAKTHWLNYSKGRGGRMMARSETIAIYNDGSWEVIDSTTYSRNYVGTIFALPCGEEWNVVNTFTYKDTGKVTRTGMEIEVPIMISYPNVTKPPQEHVCQQTVKNLCESGMQIPQSDGTPCRIMPVKEAARKRFGAIAARAFYDKSSDGIVRILLQDCRKERENENMYPATSVASAQSTRKNATTTVHERNKGYDIKATSRTTTIRR